MDINDEILNLWESIDISKLDLKFKKKNVEEHADLFWPNLYVPQKNKIELLVVGLNPSHKFPNHISKITKYLKDNPGVENNIFKKIVDPSYKTIDNVVSALQYINTKEYSKDEILLFEKIGQDEHNYFQKFWDLGKKVTGKSDTTSHIDLYQFRHSDSKILERFLISKNKVFFNDQAKLTFKYIETLKPKIIFVANKHASDIFRNKYNCKFNEEFGCHIIKIKGKFTPLILSGMITQSRAIDDYSFERLTWHIKKLFIGFT